jgi:hypothetical protein
MSGITDLNKDVVKFETIDIVIEEAHDIALLF